MPASIRSAVADVMHWYGLGWREVWEEMPFLAVLMLLAEIPRLEGRAIAAQAIAVHSDPNKLLGQLRKRMRFDVDSAEIERQLEQAIAAGLGDRIITVRGEHGR